MTLSTEEVIITLSRLRNNCDIREPERRNGYLTAILDLQNALAGSDPSPQPTDLKNLPGYFEFVYELNLRGIRSDYVRDNVRRFIEAAKRQALEVDDGSK